MKLKDRIAQIDPETYMYIGCKDGSSFFFIGKRDEYAELMGEINGDITAGYARSIRSYNLSAKKCISEKEEAEDKLEEAIEQEEAYREDVLEELKNDTSISSISRAIKTEEDHIKVLQELQTIKETIRKNDNQAKRASDRAEALTTLIRNWVIFDDREICAEHPHTVEPAGITLLVEGDVEGDFWLRSEFENWMKKRKKDSYEPVQ